MLIGIVSDIHGNAHALNAVLDELDRRGVDLVLCAGDLVCYGAQPNQVIATLLERGIPAVMGNYDHAVAWDLPTASRKPSSPRTEPLKVAALQWTQAIIDPVFKRHLRGLPFAAEFRVDGVSIHMVHAGPDHLDDWYTPDNADDLAHFAVRVRADVVVLGHTHQPFVYQGKDLTGHRGPLFVNPSAVGRSLDGDPRASFAVFDTATRHAEIIRVDYDLDAAVDAIRRTEMPVEIALLIRHAARRVEQLDLVTG